MTDAVSQRARSSRQQGTAFVTATVVRAQRPTSVKAGDVALVLGDGTIEGFVGGVCAQQSVRVYSLKAIEAEEALLLRIVPDGPVGEDPETGREVPIEEGAVTAQNPCLSGGAIEIFLEPVLPTPRVLVVGDTPIAAAVLSLGARARARGRPRGRRRSRSVARRPRARRRGARARRASHATARARGGGAVHRPRRQPKRGAGVLAELRADGVSEEHLALIDVPAGIDIGARTPAEIALSILARIVAVRRGERVAAPDHARMPGLRRSATRQLHLAADRDRPDLWDDGRRRRGHAFGGARRRDGLLLLRGLRDQVPGAT